MITHAADIEKVAISMAASAGFRWDKLQAEDRAGLRRYASAALMRLGLDARTVGKAVLAETLETAAKAAQAAVAAADSGDGTISEATRKTLQASADGLRVASAVLLGMEPATPPLIDGIEAHSLTPVYEAF